MTRFVTASPRIAAAIAIMLLMIAIPSAAQAKRLQVIADRTQIHLDPDETSPVVATLDSGAALTLASSVKSHIRWLYVYFVSPKSGQTRSGYIYESQVRKLYSEVKVFTISSGEAGTGTKGLSFDDNFKAIVDWGAEKEGIIAGEGAPSLEEAVNGNNVIRYERLIMAKRCQIEYVFNQNKLIATRYRLLENYNDRNLYIEEYRKIKDYLISKIGEPRADKVIWLDPTSAVNNQEWGTALGLGQLNFYSEWESPDTGTEIRITLAGGDNQVSFGAQLSALKDKAASF